MLNNLTKYENIGQKNIIKRHHKKSCSGIMETIFLTTDDVLSDSTTKQRFLTNQSGLPLDNDTWSKMFKFCVDSCPNYKPAIMGLLVKDPTKKVHIGIYIILYFSCTQLFLVKMCSIFPQKKRSRLFKRIFQHWSIL